MTWSHEFLDQEKVVAIGLVKVCAYFEFYHFIILWIGFLVASNQTNTIVFTLVLVVLKGPLKSLISGSNYLVEEEFNFSDVVMIC